MVARVVQDEYGPPDGLLRIVSESSREVTGEEIESHVPLMQGKGLIVDPGMARNAFHNVFVIMIGQWFDQFMGTTQVPLPPQQPQHNIPLPLAPLVQAVTHDTCMDG
ncbi:hypothetical protein J1N35_025412 [Gossypium stocksii]|uniref:Uncharacterized protein n=1 Tax=Gossypium stocksii TaxID=47602 RepID=A0A9D3ZXS8_9ROSI|nr:hypothetical protein J1N35_025412 [Gossypium stocksii]